jgi:eukaryotic-like serine/threonine-protein kinase
MRLTAGARLGPYEVICLLGAGGMGEVYRASDSRLGRSVAIKILPETFATDPDRLHRFRQEALAAAALNHPNILVVYDIGVDERAPYVVSELLDGETLRDRLQRGELSVAQVADIGAQIALGLAAAHEKSVVHRDLKPENVFLMSDGRIKILDFGLAKVGSPLPAGGDVTDLRTTTIPGTLLGTLEYMSPEQARGMSVDHRSDIFALGSILYEMLCGHRPFEGSTLADSLAALLREDAPALAPAIPRPLAQIVRRCLEKRVDRRFQSASDLAFALQGALEWLSDRSQSDVQLMPRQMTTRSVVPLPDGARLASQGSPPLAISRDGRKVACVAVVDPLPPRLCVIHLDRGEAQWIPGSEYAEGPFFSPDGAWVGFAADVSPRSSSAGELRKHSFVSGLTETVCNLTSYEGACCADDGAVYVIDSVLDGLRRASLDGRGHEPMIARFRIGSAHVPRCIAYPRMTPDRRFAIVLDWDASALGDAAVLDLASGELRTVASTGSSGVVTKTGHVLFTKTDGTLFAAPLDVPTGRVLRAPAAVEKNVTIETSGGVFAVSDTGTLVFARGELQGSFYENKRLVRLGRNGEASPLAFPPDTMMAPPNVSPDGRRLVLATRTHGLWIYDLPRGTRTRLQAGNTRLARYPVWTPDGAALVFRGAEIGTQGWKIYRQWADGRDVPEIVFGDIVPERLPCGVTPDGGTLVCEVLGDGTSHGLWLFPMPDAAPPQRVFPQRVQEVALSPDGTAAAYQSGDAGSVDVFVRSLSERAPAVQASIGGGRSPRWSRDGSELFYLLDDSFFAVTVRTASGIDVGVPQRLFTHPGVESYDVHQDGFIAVERLPGSGVIRQLELVTGWFEELLKLAPMP